MAKTATFDTSKGTIVVDLFDEEAPETVKNSTMARDSTASSRTS